MEKFSENYGAEITKIPTFSVIAAIQSYKLKID
jgi:hypothetical protein